MVMKKDESVMLTVNETKKIKDPKGFRRGRSAFQLGTCDLVFISGAGVWQCFQDFPSL